MNYDALQGNDQIHHSRYYHSFFKGFSEKIVPGKNGRGRKIERVYTEDYIVSGLDNMAEIVSRISVLVLFLISLIPFFFSAIARAPFNSTAYVAAAQMLGIIILIFELGTILFYLARSLKMTIYDYSSTSERLIKLSGIAGIVLLICFVSALITVIIYRFDLSDIRYAAGYLLAALVQFTLRVYEDKKTYTSIENDIQEPEGSNKIY